MEERTQPIYNDELNQLRTDIGQKFYECFRLRDTDITKDEASQLFDKKFSEGERPDVFAGSSRIQHLMSVRSRRG